MSQDFTAKPNTQHGCVDSGIVGEVSVGSRCANTHCFGLDFRDSSGRGEYRSGIADVLRREKFAPLCR